MNAHNTIHLLAIIHGQSTFDDGSQLYICTEHKTSFCNFLFMAASQPVNDQVLLGFAEPTSDPITREWLPNKIGGKPVM